MDDRHLRPRLPHLTEEFADALSLVDGKDGSQELSQLDGSALGHRAEQVFGVDDAQNIVVGTLVKGDAAVARFLDDADDVARVAGHRHRVEFDARRHDLAGDRVGELEDGVDQLPLLALHLARLRAAFGEGLDLLLEVVRALGADAEA